MQFTDLSLSPGTTISSWNWNFGFGSAGSNIANPVYIYPITGTSYDVRLIVMDNHGCKDTITKVVPVKSEFKFTFTTNAECTGDSTKFTPVNLAPGDVLHTITWKFGDPASGPNNTSSLSSPGHWYTTAGIYMVKMKAYNSDDCVDSVFKFVTIKQGSIADFTFHPAPHCLRTDTLWNLCLANGNPIDAIVWNFGDGTPPVTQAPPTPYILHTFPDFGAYDVTVTTTSIDGCESTKTKTVQISCISAGFTADASLNCSLQPVTFTDNSSPTNLINKWEWIFGDGKDTVYFNYSKYLRHKYLAKGIDTVYLIVSSGPAGNTISDTTMRIIEVKGSSKADFTYDSVCFGDTTKFSNTTVGNGYSIVLQKWVFGDPASGNSNLTTITDPVHIFSKPGQFEVSLSVQNELGCEDTVKKQVLVHNLPVADFTTPLACSLDHLVFTDVSKSGDSPIVNWSWHFGDTINPVDTSKQQNPFYLYSKPGQYSVLQKVTDGFSCFDTVKRTIVVLQSPISAFTLEDNVDGKQGNIRLYNESKYASFYEWDLGEGNNVNEENPRHQYKDDVDHTIRLVSYSDNDCSDTTYFVYKFLFDNLYVPNAFSPDDKTNPLEYTVFLPKGENLIEYHLMVFDKWGHLLFANSDLENGSPKTPWDGTYNGQPMPQDIYMWKINATFSNQKTWEGSETGKGSTTTMGTVALIR